MKVIKKSSSRLDDFNSSAEQLEIQEDPSLTSSWARCMGYGVLDKIDYLSKELVILDESIETLKMEYLKRRMEKGEHPESSTRSAANSPYVYGSTGSLGLAENNSANGQANGNPAGRGGVGGALQSHTPPLVPHTHSLPLGGCIGLLTGTSSSSTSFEFGGKLGRNEDPPPGGESTPLLQANPHLDASSSHTHTHTSVPYRSQESSPYNSSSSSYASPSSSTHAHAPTSTSRTHKQEQQRRRLKRDKNHDDLSKPVSRQRTVSDASSRPSFSSSSSSSSSLYVPIGQVENLALKTAQEGFRTASYATKGALRGKQASTLLTTYHSPIV